MSGHREPPRTTAPEKPVTENSTASSGLGFRLLSRVEGRKWLSTITRNTPKFTSASGEQSSPQTPIGVSTSQSQVISITAVDSSTTQHKNVTITGDDNMPQEETIQGTCNQHALVVDHIHTHRVEIDDKQQEEIKVKDQFDEDEQKKNAVGKKDSKLDEESCIQTGNRDKTTSCDVDKNEKMMIIDAVKSHFTNDENNPQEEVMQHVHNTLNVPVNDHTHRVQNDDEQQQKGKEYDDTNHIQEHQGTKDAEQQENITEEFEQGDKLINQFGENEQNKKIQLESGNTSGTGHYPNNKNVDGKKVGKLDNAPRYSKPFVTIWKNEHRFGSGSKKTKKTDKMGPKKRPHFAKHMLMDENGISCRVESNMCHQCQRNDKGRVVRCQRCPNKRYCLPCLKTWYPNMKEEKFAECCPVCLGICNCKPCLRDVQLWVKNRIDFITNKDQRVESSKLILQMILPFLKDLNEEHVREMEIEAEIKGCSISEVRLKKVDCTPDCWTYCDCCKTTILDLHRSCPRCEYDLCLTCCRELRDGQLPGCKEAITTNIDDPGPEYLHGKLKYTFNNKDVVEPVSKVKEMPEWKPLKNGSIRCPPRSLGGCRLGILELMHILPLNRVPTLLEKTYAVLKSNKLMECIPKTCDSVDENDGGNKDLCKASSRENSNDNYLYCPNALDIKSEGLKHFQCHWAKGEPIMVSNVLDMGLGLSWEPMVMWRSFRQITNINHSKLLDTTAVNCLDWQVVDINLHDFFKWYTVGTYDVKGWPQILKLSDHPPSERHTVEFISCLPFKEYTHPRSGNLNLATKLPTNWLNPNVGPKTHISYGFGQELGRGDSVTKLHFNISDVVNLLTHTATVTVGSNQLKEIYRLKRKHEAQDKIEPFGGEKMVEKVSTLDDVITDSEGLDGGEKMAVDDVITDSEGSDMADGGVLWDIFRREDTPKLELYLKKHFKEFRHAFCLPLEQVIHPIHDQTFYLTMDHKRRLKEEFGIEPWTIVQKLGDAVFVPAGCAHQVRNLKSCTNVTLDFISPESLTECIRLYEDMRLLPKNHRAKEENLEVKRIALYAVEDAVRDLQRFLENDNEHRGCTDHSTQKKPIQGIINIQNKERSRRSGSGDDPRNKKDNKNGGKTEATPNSKDYDHVKQKEDDTKDKTSCCVDDDDLQDVVNISDDDTTHTQEHQRIKETEQQENDIERECEIRRVTRSTSKIFNYQFDQDAQNKKNQLSSRKRSRSGQQNMEKEFELERSKRSTGEIFIDQLDEDEQRKNAGGKKDSKLDEESCIQEGNKDKATSKTTVDLSTKQRKNVMINGNDNMPEDETTQGMCNTQVHVVDHIHTLQQESYLMKKVSENDKEHQGYADHSTRKNPCKAAATYTSSTTVRLPKKQVKRMVIMDGVNDNMPREKHLQGGNEGKTEATPKSKEKAVIDCDQVKQKKDGKLVKDTKDNTSSCDDDELQEVINISNNTNHIQEHQKIKEMEPQEYVLEKECENRRFTRSTSKISNYQFDQDAQIKKSQLPSRKRSREFDKEEQRKNAKEKKVSKLDEEIQKCNRDKVTSCDVDKNDKMMIIMDNVTIDENNHQEEANVPVNDHIQREQNDDEQQKGKDYDDTNHIQEHQGTKDGDQQENIKESENGDKSVHQSGEKGQNKKIQLPSGTHRKKGCSELFKYDYGNAVKMKKHRYGSGYNVERNKADKLKQKKRTNFAKHMVMDVNDVLCYVESVMCHQCQRNDKGRVVRCRTCANKRYCVPCMTTWYPNMTEAMFAERCPVCRGNCNCKSCLRDVDPKVKNKIHFRPNDDQKVQGSKYILETLIPFLKCLNQEHTGEMETEAEIKRCSTSEVKLKKEDCKLDTIYCDCCKTSILDLHRSCRRCEYDLCLACCRELRDGQLLGYKKEVNPTITDPGQSNLHGERKVKKIPEWKPLKNGSIRCPPKTLGGCSRGILELTHVWSLDKVPTLLEKAQELLKSKEFMEYMLKVSDSIDENDSGNTHLCKASSRENSNDNYLYCPSGLDIESEGLKQFQCHWANGEPVMVSNVLAMGLGLSWEPMVMCRSFRQVASIRYDKHLDAKAINCLHWGKVDISFNNFFKGYVDCRFDDKEWPQILKLQDCPPSDRHTLEFISSLPFKQYTHPHDGYLNLATKLPTNCFKPDVGPKAQISYGFAQELGLGDSVTKLHFNMSDMVNVLTHTATVTLGKKQLKKICQLKRMHKVQDKIELLGDDAKMAVDDVITDSRLELTDGALGQKQLKKICQLKRMHKVQDKIELFGDDEKMAVDDVITDSERLELTDGGALWDIFRREDTPKLELYLKKHFKEFRHYFCLPLEQVIHPIHDQTFYLTMDHKKRLKEEFGIEPWTFVQKLGDAVFIPVGCAHQVRNLKSCTNVALDFVSPENFTECLKLTDDRRFLPENHPAKKDKLQVKKMALYAVEKAVKDLEILLFSDGSRYSHYDTTVKNKKRRHRVKRRIK